MRIPFISFVTSSLLTLAVASTAHADPATQACLGPVDTFLTCPAGAQRVGLECRSKSTHYSGSTRQGPSLFLRDGADPAKRTVSFAAYYKDHKKHGRVFRFDKQGRLQSWNEVVADEWHGMAVQCLPDGRVSSVTTYERNKPVGISRVWRTKDGSFSHATERVNGRTRSLPATPDLAKRPDHLCQPARCDVTPPAAPAQP